MIDITIPPEAIKAAAASICRDNGWPLSRLDACIPVARDACLAMLRSWPGGETVYGEAGILQPVIYLPLPKENSNAE